MTARTALLSFIMSTTALAGAYAETASALSTAPTLAQSSLSTQEIVPKLNIGLAHGGLGKF